MKKSIIFAALGILLLSSAAPVVAETDPVVLNQGLIRVVIAHLLEPVLL